MNQVVMHTGCGAEAGLISVDDALALITVRTQRLGTEQLPLQQALGRYLAQDVHSKINLPLFAQSAVDGYAISAIAEIDAGAEFALIGEIRAGQTANVALKNGQAVRIFTGAPIPDGTTTVARQEIVNVAEQKIVLTSPLKLHADTRDAGEEISVGQILAAKGQKLSVGAIAALSMAGISHCEVYAYPKIAVVITGDEVAENIDDYSAGKIFDANAPLIAVWFQSQLAHVEIMHVTDDKNAVLNLFAHLKDQYDVILTTGGVSVGDYDFVRPVALDLGFKQIFWKVKQKPGKPMLFAEYKREDASSCYLLGLPGNPAAVYVGMQIYTDTLLKALQGQTEPLSWFSGVITHDLKADARERFLRMSVQFEQGAVQLTSLAKQQSHMLSNLMQANGLVRIPAGQSIQAGNLLHGLLIQQ
ncbi:molybdopterin molybdotransferase MoeA [Acinetobacter tianfuensis]|uniref:Molybdopterin molybdenumtransferase n=1 Tax=Acinetobacter tianfuensis TaxID=2419603 RepID=A0A3A8ERZ8_9GAMM|nr:molybdopterin molybdotransferase MoeA [Acinetobacter tianfuensis]RKG31193.1 molybdopterin molybdenumtransferase MoeA [Acinetobacter tianfuensis]